MHDDYDYLAHATSITFGEFPNYSRELWVTPEGYGQNGPHCSIGASLMAVPFTFVFSQIDRWANPEIFESRRHAKLTRQSWTQFGFILSTQFYLLLGCLLLYKALSFFVAPRVAAWTIVLMVLCQFMPLFAFRRPLFSHVAEFALQSGFVYLLLFRLKYSVNDLLKTKVALLIGVLMGLTVLVRLNNIPIALFWPFVLFWLAPRKEFIKHLLISFGVAGMFVLLFKIYPAMMAEDSGYSSQDMQRFLMIEPLSFYFKRVWHILFGVDWGLLYTAPFLVVGAGYLFTSKIPFKKYFLLLLVPLIFNLYGVIMYKTQGAWYGYRYIVPAMIPLLVFPFARMVENARTVYPKFLFCLFGFLAVMSVLPMLLFEGNATNLTLQRITQYFGVRDWSNNTYIIEVWKTVLTAPKEFFVAAFKGGPLYVVYVTAHILGMSARLPAVVLSKYASFSVVVLIKMLIFYSFPFVFYRLMQTCWVDKRKDKRL